MKQRHWIAVASAEHVASGIGWGIMQVCHGKGGPLRRVQPGDQVIYYSPTARFRGREKLQHFTAFGIVRAGEPYRVRMTDDFHPYRRDIDYLPASPAPIGPLRGVLDFTRAGNWGWRLRLGLVEIGAMDARRIAEAMQVVFPAPMERSVTKRIAA